MKREDIFEYLYTQRYKKGIVPSLDRLLEIYNLKDLNLNSNKIIHLAGTNGKGSTSAFLKSFLEEMGQKVAVFTSPHIKNIEERFYMTSERKELGAPNLLKEGAINSDLNLRLGDLGASNKDESLINKDILIDILFSIKKDADAYQNKHPYHFITFFEYMTLAFFRWCSIEKPDYIILEVGMGGRFDATNIIDAKYGAITSISLDHTSYLGNSIEKIAFEKAGIIKKNQITVVGKIKKEALDVIRDVANKNSVKLIETNNIKLDKDFIEYLKSKNSMLKADYQISNLKVAMSLLEKIIFNDFNNNFIVKNIVKKAIEKSYWPARFEEISNDPIILRDVAHNIDGMRLLQKAILQNYKNKNIVTIFTVMKDKDYLEMLKIVESLSTFIIFCKPIERAEDPKVLQSLVKINSLVIEQPKEAFEEIKEVIKDYDNSMILATGSIFLMEYIKM